MRDPADDAFSDGEKAFKGSKCREPDPINAQIAFGRAGQLYVQQRKFSEAVTAFRRVFDAALFDDNNLNQGLALKDAADAAISGIESGLAFPQSQIAEMLQSAGICFQKCGKSIEAANCYIKSVTFYEDEAKGAAALEQGIELLNEEGSKMQGLLALQQLIDYGIEHKNYKQAVQLMRKSRERFLRLKDYEYKADAVALSMTVLALSIGDLILADEAMDLFNDYRSDECALAQKLTTAYKLKIDADLQLCKVDKKGQAVLSNEVKKLLRGLKVPENDL